MGKLEVWAKAPELSETLAIPGDSKEEVMATISQTSGDVNLHPISKRMEINYSF